LLISLIAILTLLTLGGGGLMFLTGRINQQVAAAVKDNARIQDTLNKQQKNIGDAQIFQAQVANIKTLLNNHVYLTPLFNEISKMTYVKAQYLNIDASDTGKIHLEGQVDDYSGLAKLILGLSTSKQFQDVKLLSVAPATGESHGYIFSIDLTAKSELFQNTK